MRALLLSLISLLAAAPSLADPWRMAPPLCDETPTERVCWQVDDEGDGEIWVRRRGATIRWAIEAPGAQSDLRVMRARLGAGMGLVVATRTAVSNGIAVESWTLFALPDGARAPTYRFEARDIGHAGAPFATWRAQPVYWATDWQDADDPSGRRGTGYYFVGRPFALGHDGLCPVTTLPIRSRRMLTDFRQERGGPIAWLSSRRAETRRRDPFWGGRPGGKVGEIVEAGDGDVYRYPLTVGVDGRRRTFTVGASPWDEGSARLGDGATGRLFPNAYRPAGLVGRSVRVGDGPGASHVLWLD